MTIELFTLPVEEAVELGSGFFIFDDNDNTFFLVDDAEIDGEDAVFYFEKEIDVHLELRILLGDDITIFNPKSLKSEKIKKQLLEKK